MASRSCAVARLVSFMVAPGDDGAVGVNDVAAQLSGAALGKGAWIQQHRMMKRKLRATRVDLYIIFLLQVWANGGEHHEKHERSFFFMPQENHKKHKRLRAYDLRFLRLLTCEDLVEPPLWFCNNPRQYMSVNCVITCSSVNPK